MQELGCQLTEEKIDQVMRILDSSGKGGIDYKEFAQHFGPTVAAQTRGPASAGSQKLLQAVKADLLEAFKRYNVNLADAFEAFDKDGDGKLSLLEFRDGLNQLNVKHQGRVMTAKQIEELLHLMDSDGDGIIDYREFVRQFGSTQMTTGDVFAEIRMLLRQNNANLSTLFEAFDTDGNGSISTREFMEGLRNLNLKGLNQDQIQQCARSMDADGSGQINYREFQQAIKSNKASTVKTKGSHAFPREVIASLREAFRNVNVDADSVFRRMDTGNSGTITPQHLKRGLSRFVKLTAQSYDDIIRYVDTDGDGRIDYREFMQMMRQDATSTAAGGRNIGGGRMSQENIMRMQQKFREHGVNLELAFLAFDATGDGMISAAEFRRGISALQMNLADREVDDLIRHFDSSGTGQISYREFVKEFDYRGVGANVGSGRNIGGGRMSQENVMRMQRKFREHGVNLEQAFLAFDANGDGMISVAEFRRGISALQMNLADREVDDLIRHFDSGGIGQIRYRNFAAQLGGTQQRILSPTQASTVVNEIRSLFARRSVHMRHAFDSFDRDMDGWITSDELRVGLAMLNIGVTYAQIDDVISAMNVRGRIDYGTFVRHFGSIGHDGSSPSGGWPLRSRVRMNMDYLAKELRRTLSLHRVTLRQAFLSFDTANENRITHAQFKDALQRLNIRGVNVTDIRNILRAMDSDGDGNIDWREFVKAFGADSKSLCMQVRQGLRRLLAKKRAVLMDVFATFDQNMDGVVRGCDFREALKSAGVNFSPQQIDELMRDLNIDNYGYIDYRDFMYVCGGCPENFLVKFRQTLLRIEQELTKQGLRLHTAFDVFDTGGDGLLSYR
jgi:Ca2+-binding EF-hand superfamily protein